MKKKFTAAARSYAPKVILMLTLAALVLAACSYPGRRPAPDNLSQEDRVNTAAAKTVAAIATGIAAGQNPTLVGPSSTTSTPTPPQSTETPRPAAAATKTNTPSAAGEGPCNRASFITDTTIPDGSTILPNSVFTKTWALKNVGSCPWTTGYVLVFAGRGTAMSGAASTPLITSGEVKPGDTVQASVSLRAPDEPGDYEGYWMLRSADDKIFGTGSSSATPFYVKIHVADEYSFAEHMCSAKWSSNDGDLPCPGKESDSKGYVIAAKDPQMEDDKEREGRGLLTMPKPAGGGWIVGKFPAVIVPDHTDFRATISCHPDDSGCFIRFKVTYQVDNGDEQVLGEWNEGSDGNVTEAIRDLDMVSGQSVAFNFYVYVSGTPAQSRGIWFDPRILVN